jgi:aryl-alcohol dehydrogenase-like predicted oxidoreductase
MLSYKFPFDSCQLPLNGFDATFRSFETRVLPELKKQGIAPLGMKSFGAGEAVKHKAVTPAEALRYAMSLPVTTTISGIDSMRVLRQNLKIARAFTPMSRSEMERYRRRNAPQAADGRYELYKTTAQHDGIEGREQHGFPSPEELAG